MERDFRVGPLVQWLALRLCYYSAIRLKCYGREMSLDSLLERISLECDKKNPYGKRLL
jgi:hypothetical protein